MFQVAPRMEFSRFTSNHSFFYNVAFQDGMPSFDKEICHKSAYAMCTSMLKCPAMSMVEKNEKKMCKMCTDECIPACRCTLIALDT